MRWALIFLLLIALPFAEGFTIPYGRNYTVFPHCVNYSDGAFMGTKANLTIWNESGIYYRTNPVNIAPGVFAHNLTNLSEGKCYSLDLNCTDAGAWKNEWATVCVEKEEDKMIVAVLILLPMLFAFLLIAGAKLLDENKHEILRMFMFPLSFVFFFWSGAMGIAALARWWVWDNMQDLISTMMKMATWILIIIGIYFISFMIYMAVMEKKKKDDERRNY